MYGLKALSILSLRGTGKVKGFCNKDGQGSPANHLSTEELEPDTIKKYSPIQCQITDMEFKNLWKQPENSILKNHITISCQRHLICELLVEYIRVTNKKTYMK